MTTNGQAAACDQPMMSPATRRSGLKLVIAGLAGAAFFWLTDPRSTRLGRSTSDLIDAIHQASPGTFVGIAGCGAVVVIGLWLMTRRTQ